MKNANKFWVLQMRITTNISKLLNFNENKTSMLKIIIKIKLFFYRER